MKLNQICQDIVMKKNGNCEISVREFKELKLKPPFGSINILYDKDGIEQTEKYLTKYLECYSPSTKLHLFKQSFSKVKIVQEILHDVRKIFGVSFQPEIYFSNKEIVIYNVEPKFHEYQPYTTTHFRSGISTLAKFHATFIAYVDSDVKQFKIEDIAVLKDDPFNDDNFAKIVQFILKDLNEMKSHYPNTFLNDINLQSIEWKMNILWKKLETLEQYTKVLINGNYGGENLIYSCEFSEGKIMDFSYGAHQNPILDLFQFVFSYAKTAEWHKNMEEGIALYYDNLSKELKKYNIEIEEVFKIGEFEKIHELLMPIMKIWYYPSILPINPSESFQYSPLIEVLSILKLNKFTPVECAISFEDCYWISGNLNKTAKLISYKTKSQSVKNGFMGEHHDFEIELVSKGKQYKHVLFLKAIPRSESLKEFERTAGSFLKETMFYSKYIPLLKKYNIDILKDAVPKCYFADENKYIVLENLLLLGYRTLSPRDNPRNDVIIEVLKILAKLNSSCIILEELIQRQTGSKYRVIDNFRKEFNEAFYSSATNMENFRNAGKFGMEALVELIDFDDKISSNLFKTFASKACDEQLKFAQPSSIWRNTVCHGDFWTKNYMVKFEGEQIENCIMIDFQTYRYAPPAQDLMAFIYLNSNAELRRTNMDYWLELYYSYFSDNLEKYSINVESILSKSEYHESCKFYEQFAITQSITHFQVIMASSEIMNPILSDQQSVRKIFFESRYDLVKKSWESDDIYRERLTEAVSRLRSYIISRKKMKY